MFLNKKKKNINFLPPLITSDKEATKPGTKDKMKKHFKDFFIPHHGNGFLPHSLHPRRLMFYTVAAIAVKMILFILIFTYPIEVWLSPDIAQEQSKQIIKLTNEFRATKNIFPLKENSLLDQAAYAKVQDMLVNQYFDHISVTKKGLSDWLKISGYKYSVGGENLAMGFLSADDVMQSWLASPSHRANLADPEFKEIGTNVVAGAFMGADTTLAAQIFAAPEENIEINNSVFVNKGKQLAKTKKPIKKSSIVKKIPKPSLTKQIAKQITSKDKIIMKVTAPEAQTLDVYLDGELVAEEPVKKDNQAEFSIDPTEGKHTLAVASVGGEDREFSPNYEFIVKNQPPVVDQEKTQLTVNQTPGQDSQVVKVKTSLSPDTTKVVLAVDGQYINLKPSSGNEWTGSDILFQANSTKPIVLASIIASDKAGLTSITDISWQNIKPVFVKPFEIYLFIKNHQPEALKALFNISSTYYKIILILAIFALLLNIFIEIKRQHPHVILYAFGLISFLVLLIIF